MSQSFKDSMLLSLEKKQISIEQYIQLIKLCIKQSIEEAIVL